MIGVALATTAILVMAVQDKQTPKPKTESAKAELERKLLVKLRDASISTIEREALLRDFLKRRKHELTPRLRRREQTRLAQFELANRKGHLALRHFSDIRDRIPLKKENDVLARCELGIAQASELIGKVNAAVQAYDTVYREFGGTRYARIALRARNRLIGRSAVDLDRTLRLPEKLVPLGGRPLRDRQSGYNLVVFVSPATRKLPGAVRDAPAHIRQLLFAPTEASAKAWAKKLGERTHVFHGGLYRKTRMPTLPTLPAWILTDARWRVLDRNPSRRRLEALPK